MWWNNEPKNEEREKLEAVLEALRGEVRAAKEELSETRHKHKMELEDIEHMTRITKEKLEIEKQREIMELNSKNANALENVRDGYRVKMEESLKAEVDNIKEMYGEILKRLPDVTARLKIDG